MFKRKCWSEPKRHTEKDALKKAHTTQKKTEKKTEQPKSSRCKQTSNYPGHSAGFQGWVPLPLHIVRCRPGQSR